MGSGLSLRRHALVLACLLAQAPALALGAEGDGAEPLSYGCGLAPPAAAPGTLRLGGVERPFIAVIPEDYRPDQPHQLVLAFHGRTSPNATVRRYFDLERHASRPTIFVYPSGVPAPDGTFSWSEPGDPGDGLRDYALFDALVATMAALYCIDQDRVYAVGHSLGAWFVNSLGCARGQALRAVATVAGGVSAGACEAPPAAAIVHNPNDRLVAFELGLATRDLYLAQSGADPAMSEDLDGRRALVEAGGLVCRQYPGRGDDPLLWCPHTRDHTRAGRYYPHQWPSGAAELIMSFFESLPDPPGRGRAG